MGKCLVALAVGTAAGDACAQGVTAERAGAQGQRLSKDRGCKGLREQLIAAPPPVKSFSKQTSTKIPESPQLQSKPRGPRKWEQLWEVGKAGLEGGSLSLGERLVSFVSDHASTLQRTLPSPRTGQPAVSTESLCSCRTTAGPAAAPTIQQPLLHEGKASHFHHQCSFL